jgi:SAM-dependent methyltransferase
MGRSRSLQYGRHFEAPLLTAGLSAACRAELRVPLAQYLAGEISGEMALMHLVLRLGGTEMVNPVLQRLAAAAPESSELAELVRLAAANADHLLQVAMLAKAGLASIPDPGGDAVATIRDQFDRAVAIAPEASVALYSLGSPEILDRAACEIVTRLGHWGMLRADSSVLDIGCGIGRIEHVLAPRVGAITGIDVSPGMIAEARRRCWNLSNLSFAVCDGRDLAGFAENSFDLILAVDTFPYLFAADPAIAAAHIRDAARLLRPRGNLVILNASYRGDADADRRDIAELARLYGFTVERAGSRDFTLWDGLAFVMTLPARRE